MIGKLRRRGPGEVEDGVVSGTARVDRRTKNLLARLQPNEIAVIDHEDIDQVSAEGLLHRRVRAVVNASRSSSGRYPNLGPLLLSSAGVLLLDEAGPEVMKVSEGAQLIIDGGRVLEMRGGEAAEVARGRIVDRDEAERRLDLSKEALAEELEKFAENTISYVREERDLLIEAARLPDVATAFHGRHVLVVVRGHHYKDDLVALRSYIREFKPLLVGVDGGADALRDAGLRPDMIIGDMDSVTNETLECGAELVVHAYPGGHAPGEDRLVALGLPYVVFESTGTSEDIAMLLAYEKGAELIVAVGTHANLVEFMDKGRKGMASTFLTRLRVGPILVDAKGVSRLYRTRIRRRDLFLLIGAALVTMAIIVSLSPPMRSLLDVYWARVEDIWFSIRQNLFR